MRHCGTGGLQTRKRTVLQTARGTGKECPALVRSRPCEIPCPNPFGDSLLRGQSMGPYQYLSSPNGRYRFLVLGDGSVAVRDMHYSTISFQLRRLPGQCWFPQCRFSFERDGRLHQNDQYGVAHWTTETPDQHGYASFRLTIQNDGNLVMYDFHGNNWMWQSKSYNHLGALNMIAYGTSVGNRLKRGTYLFMGQYLVSPNHDWIFLGEPESGSYVVYFKYGTPHQQAFFHTGANGHGTKFAFLRDGNLETTAGNGRFRVGHDWTAHTKTAISGGPEVLEIDNTGNLILYSKSGPWLWGACAHGPCENNCDQNGDGVDDGSCAGTKNF